MGLLPRALVTLLGSLKGDAPGRGPTGKAAGQSKFKRGLRNLVQERFNERQARSRHVQIGVGSFGYLHLIPAGQRITADRASVGDGKRQRRQRFRQRFKCNPAQSHRRDSTISRLRIHQWPGQGSTPLSGMWGSQASCLSMGLALERKISFVLHECQSSIGYQEPRRCNPSGTCAFSTMGWTLTLALGGDSRSRCRSLHRVERVCRCFHGGSNCVHLRFFVGGASGIRTEGRDLDSSKISLDGQGH